MLRVATGRQDGRHRDVRQATRRPALSFALCVLKLGPDCRKRASFEARSAAASGETGCRMGYAADDFLLKAASPEALITAFRPESFALYSALSARSTRETAFAAKSCGPRAATPALIVGHLILAPSYSMESSETARLMRSATSKAPFSSV